VLTPVVSWGGPIQRWSSRCRLSWVATGAAVSKTLRPFDRAECDGSASHDRQCLIDQLRRRDLTEPGQSHQSCLSVTTAVELEDAAVFLFGERLTAPISSIESWRKRHTHPQ
jgi:hypothetical protein